MPHADSSLVPEEITTKAEFYAHVQEQLEALLSDRWWVSNLSQVSSLLYHSYAGCALYGLLEGSTTPVVNWCGFYLHHGEKLTLGPFQGRPACVHIAPIAGKGVCADAFVNEKGVVVDDVEAYPGHIACDGDTKSEIVLPLRLQTPDGPKVVGVLDLDSTLLSTFDEDDLRGLEGVVKIIAATLDWP